METSMISDKSTILAICPPPKVLEAFDAYMGESVRKLGLHMTLATLGDLKDEDVARCIAILHEAAQDLSSINISFEGEGYLKLPDGRFAAVALANGIDLDMWRYELASVLKSEGFLNSEIDGFLPHITLAFTDEIKQVLPDSFGFKAFTVDHVYFLRGSDTKIPIFVGGKKDGGHSTSERKLSSTGSD